MISKLNRREFIQVGALGGSLSLSQYLRVQASQNEEQSHRSAIFIFMEGAPSHQDTFDLKPDASAEVRGEFSPIQTTQPGIQIC